MPRGVERGRGSGGGSGSRRFAEPLGRSVEADQIFDTALDLPADEREDFVCRACRHDDSLREEVLALLRATTGSDFFVVSGGVRQGPLWSALEADLAREDPFPPGGGIGSYRIIREIGRGGMATVFLAERADDAYAQQVALKLLRFDRDDEEVILRFEQERQILATLRHPAIARLVDGGTTEDGRPYLVMELVEGKAIDLYCDENRLTIEERLRLFVDVARAVHHAHCNLVVHRDLKPSNILVTDEGAIRLLDFGIAKLLDDSAGGRTPRTRTWVRVMTPEYASPEQICGEAVTTASDIYQLGLLLFQLLTGRLPYQLKDRPPAQVERIICSEEPIPASATAQASSEAEAASSQQVCESRRTTAQRLRKRLRGDLDTIVAMALRKEPERRYASAAELCQDLDRHLSGRPVAARRNTLGYHLLKLVQRHTVGMISVAVAVVLTVTLAVFFTVRLAGERNRARLEATKADQVADFMLELLGASDPIRASGEEVTVREMLDRGMERVELELEGQAEVQAEVMAVLGAAYTNLAKYESARTVLERALELRIGHWGPDHYAVSASLNDLARLYMIQGNYTEAEPLYERAIRILEQAPHVKPSDLAMAINNFATLHATMGRFDEAQPLFRRAHEIREQALGSDHPEVAASINNLAGLHCRLGEYDEAEPLFRRAIGIWEATLGTDHPDLGDGLNNLAIACQHQGKAEEAEQLLRRALGIWETALGERHPKVARTLNNLASLRASAGNFAEAKTLLERSLAIRTEVFGEEHVEVASCLDNLGFVTSCLGRLDNAQSLHREAYEMTVRVLGAHSPAAGRSLAHLAATCAQQGQYVEAEPLFRQSVEVLETSLGAEHPLVSKALFGLACLESDLGRYNEAELDFERALTVIETAFGPDHHRVVPILDQFARLRTRQGKYEEARHLFQRGLAAIRQQTRNGALGPVELGQMAAIQVGRGELMLRLGEAGAARAALDEAVTIIEGLSAVDDVPDLLDTHAKALLLLGRVDEARPVVDRLLATGWRDDHLLELCLKNGLQPPVA